MDYSLVPVSKLESSPDKCAAFNVQDRKPGTLLLFLNRQTYNSVSLHSYKRCLHLSSQIGRHCFDGDTSSTTGFPRFSGICPLPPQGSQGRPLGQSPLHSAPGTQTQETSVLKICVVSNSAHPPVSPLKMGKAGEPSSGNSGHCFLFLNRMTRKGDRKS